ncbi:MAG TPA: oligosaccharide flippase family protein [Pyrinomonadaceae bacterium]|nr:oligosaccharide flippase family protein [Pyrinomonadaceae bacterium]
MLNNVTLACPNSDKFSSVQSETMLRSLIFRTLIVNCGINALGLFNSILLSHWLGPVGRGEIAAAMLWPMLLAYLFSAGIISSTAYFSAARGPKVQSIFSNAMALAMIQSAVALVVGYVALPYLLGSQSANVVSVARLYLLVIPITLSTQYGTSILQGRMHMSAFNWLRTIIPLGYLAGTIALAMAGKLILLNIVILHLSLTAATWLGAMAALLRFGIRPSFQPETGLGKEMLRYGAKVQVGNVSGFANQSLDQVLMAAWLPPAYLGLYVVAVSSASISQVFSQAVQTVSTPSITQRQTNSERAAVLQGVFRRYWLLSLLGSLAISAVLPIAIPIVFGIRFTPAIWPAEVLLLGTLLGGARAVLAGGAQALGDPWLGSKAHLGALVVTVLLLYLLLPMMGIIGAAIATASACGMELLIVVAGLRSSHSIPAMNLFRPRAGDLSSAFRVFDVFRAKRESLLPDQG